MITRTDKLNMVVWAFKTVTSDGKKLKDHPPPSLRDTPSKGGQERKGFLFSTTTWGTDLKSVPLSSGMASFADAYWIKPNWLKTEQVVIHDPELAQVLEGIKVVQLSDIHIQGGIQLGGQISNLSPKPLIAQVNALKPNLPKGHFIGE
jgi:hypothetical protein